MANRSAVNPKLYNTLSPVATNYRTLRAADSKTWKQGEFGELSSGTVQPISGASSAPYCIFAEDQTTSTSSSDVKVLVLEDGMRFEMYVTSDGTDATIGTANIGTGYDVYTSSNITYLDTNGTTGAQMVVEQIVDSTNTSSTAPERMAFDAQLSTTAPGLCIVRYTT